MIELSFTKLLVLALIALIVLGPEKLPVVARTAGALIRRVRGGWDTVRAEVERELEVEEIRRAAREVVEQKDKVEAELNATLKEVKDLAGSITASKPVVRPAITQIEPAITDGGDVPRAAPEGTADAATDVVVEHSITSIEASPAPAQAPTETEDSASPEARHGSI